MNQSTINITQDDGYQLPLRLWVPKEKPQGVIHVCHGMAEHSGRYQDFAQWISIKGWAVVAQDHRGHGLNLEKPDEVQGFFGPQHGWNRVVADSLKVLTYLEEEYPRIPLILLGHSMGSFLARTLASKLGRAGSYQGYIFSGTAGKPGIAGLLGAKLAKWEAGRRGKTHASTLMNSLMFDSYSKAFRPNRTAFDWVSSSSQEVDGYVDDPWCGFLCTSQFYQDLLEAVLFVNSPSCFATQNPEIPVYLFSGAEDPVGNFGKGVQWVGTQLEKFGVRDLEVTLYPRGRHEMFHETNKEQVFEDLWTWIEKRFLQG